MKVEVSAEVTREDEVERIDDRVAMAAERGRSVVSKDGRGDFTNDTRG